MEQIRYLKTEKDLDWFSKNFSKKELEEHSGKWVAIKNGIILAFGDNFREVLKNARNKSDNPLLIKIAKEKEILIC
jgi:hypothetical protein